jgi:hypothetical protein
MVQSSSETMPADEQVQKRIVQDAGLRWKSAYGKTAGGLPLDELVAPGGAGVQPLWLQGAIVSDAALRGRSHPGLLPLANLRLEVSRPLPAVSAASVTKPRPRGLPAAPCGRRCGCLDRHGRRVGAGRAEHLTATVTDRVGRLTRPPRGCRAGLQNRGRRS